MRGVSSSFNTHADVENGEGVFPSDKDWLIYFETEDFGIDEIYWRAIDPDEATAFLGMGYRRCGLVNRLLLEDVRMNSTR